MQPYAHEIIDLLSDSEEDSAKYMKQELDLGIGQAANRLGGGQGRQEVGGITSHDNPLAGPYVPNHDIPPRHISPAVHQPHAAIDYQLPDLSDQGEFNPWQIDFDEYNARNFLDAPAYGQNTRQRTDEPSSLASVMEAPKTLESKADCINKVVAFYPGICPDYVSELYGTISQVPDDLIVHVLDLQENGKVWPKAKEKEKENQLKRKRDFDEDEVAARKYAAVNGKLVVEIAKVRDCLRLEFAQTPMAFIDSVMLQNQNHLFPTYRVLEEAERTWNEDQPPYNKLKKPRTVNDLAYLNKAQPERLDERLARPDLGSRERDVLVEFQIARKMRKKADLAREAEFQAARDEELNVLQARAEGTMSECGCCFDDYPLNRMVHCNNEDHLHWFCRQCAKQMAENEIGNSKYELNCMSMDGCKAGFAQDQRTLFLDEKSCIALERNEQEAMLRMSGIENLASCPFCPYAAEYPPVEINKEFQCMAPDCEKVSCRLCKLESHIPKTCEENAKENGLSIRRQIEEAMSAALIRKCNKCGTPFVKEEGCNKMTCTRNHCFNVQCYICSKSCTYDHFDDVRRGGKNGNCPLFESVEQRHDDEVLKAEQEALQKVRAEHPEYSEEDLKVKMSENVAQDDARRKANNHRGGYIRPGVNAGVFEPLFPVPIGDYLVHRRANLPRPPNPYNIQPALAEARMHMQVPEPPPAAEEEFVLNEVERVLNLEDRDADRFRNRPIEAMRKLVYAERVLHPLEGGNPANQQMAQRIGEAPRYIRPIKRIPRIAPPSVKNEVEVMHPDLQFAQASFRARQRPIAAVQVPAQGPIRQPMQPVQQEAASPYMPRDLEWMGQPVFPAHPMDFLYQGPEVPKTKPK
ncbi:E3 ubiquitin-protein ligase RNF216-like protein 2 [Phlyctema vagabunda]|uniref:E3 ubiquitin-protein ligase RNF216-like protein 2 n=1 Tax=Phlyctema vagabunda TaxID=108571 RepID=A0ABR4PA90_9HELO